MTRPWQIWTAFSLCALLALGAMGWLTLKTIEIDQALINERSKAELEQEISLALWRMDTKLAPLIAEEVARPPAFFLAQPAVAENPFAEQQAALPFAQPVLPKNVFLNFDVTAEGLWNSPQVSSETNSTHQAKLKKLEQAVQYSDIISQLPEASLPAVDQSAQQFELQPFYAANSPAKISLKNKKKSAGKIDNYLQDRNRRYQDVAQQELRKQRSGISPSTSLGGYGAGQQSRDVFQQAPPPTYQEGISRPIWVGDNLLLARRVEREGTTAVQGSWLDWPNIKTELLEEVDDSIPTADLVPVKDVQSTPQSRMLAGLPVKLVVRSTSRLVPISPPIRLALQVGWGALLVAIGAVGLLLWGVVALSERRAAFVSSVTHELRTPLTTFRMYADMLARGMVPDADRRQEYLETLQSESERLTHLVENVLSYARLERGRGLSSREEVSIVALLDRMNTRLSERAKQADMDLQLTLPDSITEQKLTTDVSMVEQILFNLVDNAAKYAATAEDKRIHCDISQTNQSIQISIRDHGPGFEKTRAANRPQPFSKTSEQAAVTAPGVGLGLALCSRLAKQLGGKLTISGDNDGATVTLALPTS